MKKKNIFIFLIIISIFSCKNESLNTLINPYPTYFCDLETLNKEKGLFLDSNFSNITYKNTNLRVSNKSFSGKHSIKLTKKSTYGLGVKIPIEINDFFKISVWKYSDSTENKGHLVVSIENKELYIQEKEIAKRDSSGWEQIIIKIRIPPFIKSNKMSIYVWQAGENDVYFDNLKIEKIEEEPKIGIDSLALKIFIDEAEYDKLINIRKEAINIGILETNEDSWIKAIIFDKEEMYNVKMRLKGDWLDHIQGTKWSFRIKIKKDGSWRRMREFSIQDPKTRFFQYEWLGHKIMEQEGVLSPRYGFIPVYINNTFIGIYAYEEHFDKQLIESKNKREGPILKLSEEGFWSSVKIHKTLKKLYNLPVFESSTILPYKLEKTLKTHNLRSQFLIAQNLLNQHKNCESSVSELFDIELAAKYYAIIDLTKMYHGMRWHNQRFYYNPVTSKLEIIGYDGYTATGVYSFIDRAIIGNKKINDINSIKPESRINNTFFIDSLFLNEYVKNLKKFSDSLYLKELFLQLQGQIELYNELLNEEYFRYSFDENFYYNNARKIRNDLPEYIDRINSGAYDNIGFKNLQKTNYEHDFHYSLPKDFVKVYSEKSKTDTFIYKVINYLSHKIEITGIISENKKKFSIHQLNKTSIGEYNSVNNELLISSEYPGSTLLIKIAGVKEEYSVPIIPWNSPKNESPRQELENKSIFPINEYYEVKKGVITFRTGKITINKNIIIPQNYKVIINAGTELNFINNSIFLSYSPIYMSGKENKKILIYSSDNTAKGFTIIQAKQKSEINHVDFSGFNTLNYKGWSLTGAVNFYESDVTIINTTFKKNVCEDALNIINSDFYVQNCSFENIFSDAFDSDFCTGELSKTTFNKVANDAIDFSGSTVNISDCKITNARDKGISGGENSILKIYNCTISDSKIGVAAKDESTITLNNSNIKNCYYGLVAFQKKPEFGPAIIKSSKLTYSNLINLHLIEKKSILQLNNKKIFGYDKNTAKRFY